MINDSVKTDHNNLLLMYLLQNRAKDFINEFESQNNRCFMGGLSLYKLAFANKILLSDTNWTEEFLPIVDRGRKENQSILSYLERIISISQVFSDDFKKFIKPFAWFPEYFDFETMLDGTLEWFEAMGYRKIDCLVYEAGLKFDFKELDRLLEIGADPYIIISAYNSPSIAQKMDLTLDDAYSLFFDAGRHYSDCISIYGIGKCWEEGMAGKETIISQSLVNEFFLGAGCKLVCEIIQKYK